MVSDSDPLSLVFVLIFFFQEGYFHCGFKTIFLSPLTAGNSSARRITYFLSCAGPSSLQKFPMQSGAWVTRHLCFPTHVSPGSSCGCGVREAARVLDVSDRGDQTTWVFFFLRFQKLALCCAAGARGDGWSTVPSRAQHPSAVPAGPRGTASLRPAPCRRPWRWLGCAAACLWAQRPVPGHQLCLIMNKSNSLNLKGCSVSFTSAMAFRLPVLPKKNS